MSVRLCPRRPLGWVFSPGSRESSAFLKLHPSLGSVSILSASPLALGIPLGTPLTTPQHPKFRGSMPSFRWWWVLLGLCVESFVDERRLFGKSPRSQPFLGPSLPPRRPRPRSI